MATDVIILFAHGARDPEWARPVKAVAQRLREGSPGRHVEVAFLEFMKPTLPEAVAEIVSEGASFAGACVQILPFFIAQGGHLRKELPEMLDALRAQYPQQSFFLLPPLGELHAVQEAMAEAIAGLIF
ncbi:MAG: Sirohydrochlorin cobaltochelatase CbiX [Fluviibacter phosphoraccumulans EoVTN8]